VAPPPKKGKTKEPRALKKGKHRHNNYGLHPVKISGK